MLVYIKSEQFIYFIQRTWERRKSQCLSWWQNRDTCPGSKLPFLLLMCKEPQNTWAWKYTDWDAMVPPLRRTGLEWAEKKQQKRFISPFAHNIFRVLCLFFWISNSISFFLISKSLLLQFLKSLPCENFAMCVLRFHSKHVGSSYTKIIISR